MQERMSKKLTAKANKIAGELIDIFDVMNQSNQGPNEDERKYLTQEIIEMCMAAVDQCNVLGIDEKVKAKLLSRLIREYRRSLEFKRWKEMQAQNEKLAREEE